jgi:UDP-N-acetylmuramoyl-L-alanyl-D-glutamate--2,6-diaminopimelate ligase
MSVEIKGICFDSRKVKPGFLFIAVKGTQSDGHEYITKAIDSGAVAVVCETLPPQVNGNCTFITVRNSSEALGIIASNYAGKPSEKIKLLGVTGTNGKTTVATLLYKLFGALGHRPGLLSTVENKILDEVIIATHTTPDPIQLNDLLKRMVDSGCTHVFMEVVRTP